MKLSNDIHYDVYDYFAFIKDAELGQRGYALTSDEAYLVDYYNALAKIEQKEQEIILAIQNNNARTLEFKEILALKELKMQELVHTVSLVKVGKIKEALDTIDNNLGLAYMTRLRSLVGDFRADEILITSQLRENYYLYKNIIYILFVVALIVTGYNYYNLRGQITPLISHLKYVNGNLQQTITEKEAEIQERARVEAENSKLLTHLNQKNQELNHFAYIASHDLQEPLRTIKNFIQLYEEEYGDNLNEEAKSYFDFIIKASNRMSTLIHGLLLYSKIGSSASFSKNDINQLLEEAKENLNSLLEERNVIIEVADLPTIDVYKIEMVQLFQNLIQNAIKFCPNKQPLIQIGYKELPNEYEFFVSDNGIGMDQKDIQKIFNMFARLHNEKEYAGQGIGLAFCKKIAELHGGKISVESQLNKGTTFYITISKNVEHV
ncbi:MAG: CHASE3 domain-containing protein [Saprospiraceae bacterium]|nr:CHASE3 domain-containing protein [Saprospiraceae bacterium]